MVEITSDELFKMTSRALLELLGIESYLNRHKPVTIVHSDGKRVTWNVWQTMGKGRQSGHSYIHLSTEVALRVVDPDGKDTGIRVQDVAHIRGRTSLLVRELKYA